MDRRQQGRWPYLIVDLREEKKGRFRNPNYNPKASRSEKAGSGPCVPFCCTFSLFPGTPGSEQGPSLTLCAEL